MHTGRHQSSHSRRSNRHSHPQNVALSNTSLFSPFGFTMGGSLVDNFFGGGLAGNGGFTSFSSSTFSNAGGPVSGNVKRTSTSTRFVNGKKITTKK